MLRGRYDSHQERGGGGNKAVELTKDPDVIARWNSMSFQDQISNIGSEVLRADRWKQKGNIKRMRAYYDVAISFLSLSIIDPKNAAKRSELNRCIDELEDYFVGENSRGTTSEKLREYYDTFL